MVEVSLLVDIGLILVAATLFSFIARLLKQPPLLAYILAGIAIGPVGLAALNLQVNGFMIGVYNIENIQLLAELGIAFLLFSIGIETDLRKLLRVGKTVVLGSLLQLFLTVMCVLALSSFFAQLSFLEQLYIGIILSFSSTMVVVKILDEGFKINTVHGRLVVGFLLMQDFLVLLILPAIGKISTITTPGVLFPIVFNLFALLLITVILGKFVFPRIFRFSINNSELLFLTATSSCFIFIILSFLMNFSIIIGGFLAGLSLSVLPYNIEIHSKIRGLRDFFVTIFFVSLGIQLNLSFLTYNLLLLLFFFIIIFLIKPVIFYGITMAAGYGSRVAFFVAVAMAQVSEFSFVIANEGFAQNILGQNLFSMVIFTTAASMAATPYLMHYTEMVHFRLSKYTSKTAKKIPDFFYRKIADLEKPHVNLTDHLVIAGSKTMGGRIVRALNREFPLIVIDNDAESILASKRDGVNAIYGSIDSDEILQKANIATAKMLVNTVPSLPTSINLIQKAKRINPRLIVYSRARYYNDASALYKAGADYVCLYHYIAADHFIEKISRLLSPEKNFAALMNSYDESIRLKEQTANGKPDTAELAGGDSFTRFAKINLEKFFRLKPLDFNDTHFAKINLAKFFKLKPKSIYKSSRDFYREDEEEP